MMAYIPREKERHPDQMDRGRIKFAPRNKQKKGAKFNKTITKGARYS